MAKDPFANLPKLEPEEATLESDPATLADPDHAETAEDVTAGAPPRNLLKNLSKWAVPVMGVAVGVWLFLPEDQAVVKRAAPTPVAVDVDKQATDSLAYTEKLKSEASTRRPAVVPVMPGSAPAQAQTSTATGGVTPAPSTGPVAGGTYPPAARPPVPPTYGGPGQSMPPLPTAGMDEKQQAAHQAYLDRQQEIRASAIEVPKVRLVNEAGQNAPAVPQPIAGLTAQIAAEREGANALRAQQELHEKLVTAMAPKEQPRSRGANEDFLAQNAAATPGASLTHQMRAHAGSIVGEGKVIRSVLLTAVESDLPGRVLARVTSDVYDSQLRNVVIPKGSLITGVYSTQVVVGQERLLMAMNRLVLPNGSWINLSGASATDPTGVSGMKAEVNNHFLKMFGSSLVIGASSLLLPRADTTVSTVPGIGGNGGAGTAGSVFANSLNEVVKNLLERNKQIPPTLSLRAGDEFVFMVTQDMAMVPYSP